MTREAHGYFANSAGLIRHFEPGQHPEALRIAFVELEIGGFVVIHDVAHRLPDRRMGEPVADRLLSRMSERGVADVVRKCGGRNGCADVARLRIAHIELPAQVDADRAAERTRDRTGFEAVGQPGADIVGLGERKHLGLILKPPERTRKNNPVEVALKRRPRL